MAVTPPALSACQPPTHEKQKTELADRNFTVPPCVEGDNAPEMQQMPASPDPLHNDACYASPVTDKITDNLTQLQIKELTKLFNVSITKKLRMNMKEDWYT